MKTEWKDVCHLYLGCECNYYNEGFSFKPINGRLKSVSEDSMTVGNTDVEQKYYGFIKPILRPLSDLTKEIEINGEKFIPIQRLQNFEINAYLENATDNSTLIKIYSAHGEHVVKYHEPYSNMDDGIIEFGYCERFHRFFKRMLFPCQRPLSSGGQLQMFKQLFDWHFDLFSLIPNGYAIDRTTLTSLSNK